MPKQSLSNRTQIISAHNKVLDIPANCYSNHSPNNDLSRVFDIVSKELKDLPGNARLNLLVSNFSILPNAVFRDISAQITTICSLVSSKGNGGLAEFARIIPPPAEAKSPLIKNSFTPVLNCFELYNKLDQLIIAISKNSGTKGTFFGGGQKNKYGFTRKSTDWMGTNCEVYEPTDTSPLSLCYSLREGVLKERSVAFMN